MNGKSVTDHSRQVDIRMSRDQTCQYTGLVI